MRACLALLLLGLGLGAGSAWAQYPPYGPPGHRDWNGGGSSSSSSTLTTTALLATAGTQDPTPAQLHYVAHNRLPLQADLARGAGEHVEAMTQLFGCPAALSSALARQARRSPAALDGTAADLLAHLRRSARADVMLAQACTRLG